MSFPIKRRIGTVFIPVKDIKSSRDWYCHLLGLSPTDEILFDHLYVIPLETGTNLVLDSKIYNEANIKDIPLFHFNTDSINEAYDYVKAQGIHFVTEIENEQWFNIKDPDGNVIMICEC
ncbi:VOC family protein [Bacillus sp. JCM 19034]|uniref:VOC family protein n=1 Tax=Bacillus sp. JCM 19034 TaxID=1481928 RepID=UPI0007803AD8|nr:VOC family protein [Bacillus sp. JCM 19034]